MDFLAVCVHEGALAVGVLHDLVDYELGVTVDVQASCSDVDGYVEAADECFIFCNVVGCRKMEANCVLELASFWGDQDDPGPCVKRPLIREDLKVIQYQSQEADNTFITSDGTSP